MKCVKCGGSTMISHSHAQISSQYRKRVCTNLECRHSFGTWEVLETPAAMEARIRREMIAEGKTTIVVSPRKKEDPIKRRTYQANWRANNPEKARALKKRTNLRAQARVEAAATNRPVQEIYEAWGVA